MQSEVTTLAQLIRDANESSLLNLHTALPATVLAFYPNDQTVDVQPSLKSKLIDNSLVSLPVISGVPVQYPRSSQGGIKFPLLVGDQVLLVFSERSLDTWKSRGGEVDPQEGRKFNLTDAFAIPGVFSPAKADGSFPTTGLEIKWGATKAQFTPLGTMTFTGIAGLELLNLLSQTLAQCALIQNSAGPTNNAAAFTALKLLVDQLRGGI